MTRLGILGEHELIVLIDGLLVRKMPKGDLHVAATRRAFRALQRLDAPGWFVCKEDPILLEGGPGGHESVPEPDICVIRGALEDYDRRKPGPADIGLIVEVSDTSARKDRGMLARYAHASIPITWLVDLKGRAIEAHAYPTGPARRPRYRKVARFGEKESVPVVLDGVEVGRIAVTNILP
jgi:Uma2 family endonuclease